MNRKGHWRGVRSICPQPGPGLDRIRPLCHRPDRGPSRMAGLVVTTPPPGFTKKPTGTNQVAARLEARTRTSSRRPRLPLGDRLLLGLVGRPGLIERLGHHPPVLPRHRAASGPGRVPSGDPALSVQLQVGELCPFRTGSGPGGSRRQGLGVHRHWESDHPARRRRRLHHRAGPGARAARPDRHTGGDGSHQAALAQQEYRHLGQALPGFDLVRTSVPLVPTVVYWGVYGGLVLLAVIIPLGVRRARRMRADARRRAAQRQHQVRGSKIARRQAARRR